MKVLLLGRRGQVGNSLRPQLDVFGQVVALGREDIDLSNLVLLRKTLDAIQPGLIVNAAAYTDVDGAETQCDNALAINAFVPKVLSEWAEQNGAALIHYSTDYVFDGTGDRPWSETDQPSPINVYGESKRDGDEAILGSAAAALILRTSWIYAPRGKNFFRTMLKLGSERRTLSVVTDQVGAPTTASVLANITIEILNQANGQVVDYFKEKGGLVNATTTGETSWHGFATRIFDSARKQGLPMVIEEVEAILSSDYQMRAARPLNSRLDCTRLADRFGIHSPGWEQSLDDLIRQIISPSPD